jgi:hypothetical protein
MRHAKCAGVAFYAYGVTVGTRALWRAQYIPTDAAFEASDAGAAGCAPFNTAYGNIAPLIEVHLLSRASASAAVRVDPWWYPATWEAPVRSFGMARGRQQPVLAARLPSGRGCLGGPGTACRRRASQFGVDL